MDNQKSETISTESQGLNSMLGVLNSTSNQTIGTAPVREKRPARAFRDISSKNQMGDQVMEIRSLEVAPEEQSKETTNQIHTKQGLRIRRDRTRNRESTTISELETLRLERDAATELSDKVISDLIIAQQKLEEQEHIVARKEAEILNWRGKFDLVLQESKIKEDERAKVETLHEASRTKQEEEKQLRENDLFELRQRCNQLALEKDEVVRQKEGTVSSRVQSSARIWELQLQDKDDELNNIKTDLKNNDIKRRRKLEDIELQFKTKLLNIQEEIRQKEDALKESEIEWHNQMEGLQSKYEATLQDERETMANSITTEQSKRQDTEIQLQGLQIKLKANQEESDRILETSKAAALSHLEVEKGKAEQYLKELRDLRALPIVTVPNSQYLTELEDLKRISNLFKNNSERLSREMKGILAKNRDLDESVRGSKREISQLAEKMGS